MDGILICTALLIAIALLRLRGQESDSPAYAPVRVDTDENISTGAIYGNSFMLHESPLLFSDNEWTSSSTTDDSAESTSYDFGTSSDTDWVTDPSYAYMVGNIYHDPPMDPTYHDDSFTSSSDDDWSSSTTSFDDSFSSASSDDSWSDNSFSDSFSSSSFND